MVPDNRTGTVKSPKVSKITLIKPFLMLQPKAVVHLLLLTMCETNEFKVLLVHGPPRPTLSLSFPVEMGSFSMRGDKPSGRDD